MHAKVYKTTMRKRRRQLSDRLALDVGGRTFVTSKDTLCYHSTYFATLFSDRWEESLVDDHYCFLDQDPEAFAILLKYMRTNLIAISELDATVLLQMEYFGIELLLKATKVQAYLNMEPSFSGSEKEAVHKFDERYGGMKNAIIRGDLPKYLVEMEEGTKEFAILHHKDYDADEFWVHAPGENSNEEESRRYSLLGALNWLFYHGYTVHEDSMKWNNSCSDKITFSRTNKTKMVTNVRPESTKIIIENNKKRRKSCRRTFALCLSDGQFTNQIFSSQISDNCIDELAKVSQWWSSTTDVICVASWLHKNHYIVREFWLEKIFACKIERLMKKQYSDFCGGEFQIYSRDLTTASARIAII